MGRCVKLPMLAGCILLLLLSTSASADEWKSPDGVIAVTIPDPARFVEANVGPEALVSWQSTKNSIVMGVAEMANPKNYKLALAPVVEGFAKEFRDRSKNSRILNSSVEVRNGHEVFIMTGQGEIGELMLYMTQILTSTRGKVYKAIVSAPGIDTRTDPDVIAFLASFKPLVLKQSGPFTQDTSVPDQQSKRLSGEQPEASLSYNLGYFAGTLLIAALVLYGIKSLLRLSRATKTRDDDEEDDDRPRRRKRRRDEDDKPRRKRQREEDEDD